MSPAAITSPTNARIKRLVRLRRRRHRDAEGVFLVEGAAEVGRATDAAVELTELYLCPELRGGSPPALPADVEATAVSAEVFAKISARDDPDGVLAVARQFPTDLDRLSPGSDSLLLIVEGIEKPGNLGAMLRTAAAAGIDAVVVCDPATDVFNPNVVRNSLGALFLVPIAVAPADLTRRWLAEAGISWFATSGHGGRELWGCDLTAGVALVVGSEHQGLTPEWLAEPDRVVHIPTPGQVDSLNASVAAAIVLYEAVRQRSSRAAGGAYRSSGSRHSRHAGGGPGR